MQTQFTGEHLLPGQLGQLFAVITFVASLLSALSYFMAAQTENTRPDTSFAWMRVARNAFVIHAAGILACFATLYYIITNHLFEYHYAWAHSDRSLPSKYLLSCFWEGQQGSFLLWSFWNSVLGMVVMLRAKALESRAMTVIALIQACLAGLVLGIYLPGDIQIGTSPFILLRHQMQGAPIFAQADYLSSITDGNGLNVLLQNYWMVIHPPVLFLGFSSTLFPFAFAVAALWKGDYKSFVKPALSWSLFSAACLGTGIMMGGAWAYESLNFGGYWAWDPVENASLVPWLILVAGLHTLLVYRATGRSLRVTLLFFILTYTGIWYSTFLTRTGVLGDTSVHAFTGEGKSLYWYLIAVIGFVAIPAIALLIKRRKTLPDVAGEEHIATREFWMFIGSFVLLLSALQISISTSIPIWAPLAKTLTGKDFAPAVDVVAHYNNIQIWVSILLMLLCGGVLYLRYKTATGKVAAKKLAIAALAGAALTVVLALSLHIKGWPFLTLLYCTCFCLCATVLYAISLRGSIKKMGPSLAHFGFAVLMAGILITGTKKQVVSLNTLGSFLPLGKTDMREAAKESRENVMLYENTAVAMDDFWVTYLGDSTSAGDPRTFFKVRYDRRDSVTGKIQESFMLYPDAFVNAKGQQGLSPNPASKHYWDHDIFTYVNSFSGKTPASTLPDTFKTYRLLAGDTVFLKGAWLVFKGFDTEIKDARYVPQQGDISVAANIEVQQIDGRTQVSKPIYFIRDQMENFIDDTLKNDLNTALRFAKIIPEENRIELKIREIQDNKQWIVLKAIRFPHINLVWLGTILMVAGFLLSLARSVTKKRSAQANA